MTREEYQKFLEEQRKILQEDIDAILKAKNNEFSAGSRAYANYLKAKELLLTVTDNLYYLF